MPTVGTDPIAGRATYVGLFLITLATLMYEILLTRIFSVTMYYHSAFFAISVAMFGMTVGALIVYLRPGRFAGELVHGQLLISALLFSVSMVLGFLVHLAIPFHAWWYQATTYIALALPFTFSGIVVCLALTKFSWQVGLLYAADLFGAALGCILLIWVLDITDAGTAVVITAALACIGALSFSIDVHKRLVKFSAAFLLVGLVGLVIYNIERVANQDSLLRLLWVKFEPEVQEKKPEYIRWNAFSRIQVRWAEPSQPDTATAPVGWGLSPKTPYGNLLRQRYILIDASAATVMTEYAGDLDELQFLKYDISNLAHHLRDDARVLVVGAGGGRDLLSALVFDQREVVGVEINGDILATVNSRYGDFTGHLDQHPRIKIVNDEARSYIARQPDGSFDILQVSLIDTWAATAAGAFVLTENSLYTVEAWQLFLQKLADRGLLSFSRWYYAARPAEAYRLTSLASAALMANGIENPRDHIAMLKLQYPGNPHAGGGPDGTVTMLVSKTPFTKQDLNQLQEVATRMEFGFVVTPGQAEDATFAQLASGQDLARVTSSFPINITPPTDDNPFFFNMLWLGDLFASDTGTEAAMSHNLMAVKKLGTLLIVVFGLTVLCIVVPLLLTLRRVTLKGSGPLFLFFAGIGLGFLLIEISLMQRLILFLGHPTYGLAVVLFALLLSGGLGSYLTQRVPPTLVEESTRRLLLTLLGLLLVLGLVTSGIAHACAASSTPVRILVAVVLVFLVGLPMGTAFPLGMRMARVRAADLTPWLWGINGATSVCASVLATAISLTFGIAAAHWTGWVGYGLALLATVWLQRRGSG
ncbi:MAG: spermidine synthase family protein [Planctomycetota bacterium]|jgi:hypothetical protein